MSSTISDENEKKKKSISLEIRNIGSNSNKILHIRLSLNHFILLINAEFYLTTYIQKFIIVLLELLTSKFTNLSSDFNRRLESVLTQS